MSHPHALPSGAPANPPPPSAPPQWSSELLLGGQREARIAHQGSVYTLRLTASGKLILTK
jgi:hemin uptake protein HemP